MRIWFDLANSAHVFLFSGIIKALKERGHHTFVTVRDYAQTRPLAEKKKIPHIVVGKHGGRSYYKKAFNLINRSLQLYRIVRNLDIDVAVSHNSADQALVARLLKIPFVTIQDTERQIANHLVFRLATKILVPRVFPDEKLHQYGASPKKVVKLDGVKEQIYIVDFQPEPDFPEKLNLPTDKIICTLRPPDYLALHDRVDNPLFYAFTRYLLSQPNTFVIILPRTEQQKERFLQWENHYPNLRIQTKVVDGLMLMYYSDIVVTAGGTMAAEAALLGTPAYTLLKNLRAVDLYLAEQGYLTIISSPKDFTKVKLEKKQFNRDFKKYSLKEEVIKEILNTAKA
ncbi:DUF354 domain-containing protein [bacterium]|nr:DUF354 domain-containing protein [bacterium]